MSLRAAAEHVNKNRKGSELLKSCPTLNTVPYMFWIQNPTRQAVPPQHPWAQPGPQLRQQHPWVPPTAPLPARLGAHEAKRCCTAPPEFWAPLPLLPVSVEHRDGSLASPACEHSSHGRHAWPAISTKHGATSSPNQSCVLHTSPRQQTASFQSWGSEDRSALLNMDGFANIQDPATTQAFPTKLLNTSAQWDLPKFYSFTLKY